MQKQGTYCDDNGNVLKQVIGNYECARMTDGYIIKDMRTDEIKGFANTGSLTSFLNTFMLMELVSR